MEQVCESERLVLVKLTDVDAPLVLELFNQPDCLRFIGDRGIRDLNTARDYIQNNPGASYREHGYGMYLIKRKEDNTSLGLCGLVKRDYLQLADIGFALLTRHEGRGYAFEAAELTLAHGKSLGLTEVAAITSTDNDKSVQLLEKLGLEFVERFIPPGQDSEVNYFTLPLV